MKTNIYFIYLPESHSCEIAKTKKFFSADQVVIDVTDCRNLNHFNEMLQKADIEHFFFFEDEIDFLYNAIMRMINRYNGESNDQAN